MAIVNHLLMSILGAMTFCKCWMNKITLSLGTNTIQHEIIDQVLNVECLRSLYINYVIMLSHCLVTVVVVVNMATVMIAIAM